MDMSKPFKGRLKGAFQMIQGNPTKEHLGYIYVGTFLDHPEFKGNFGHTSAVVKDNCDIPRHVNEGYMIETLNSRYTIVPEEDL